MQTDILGLKPDIMSILVGVNDWGYDEKPNEYWLFDGVHPSTAGHGLIKREWVKAFNNL